MFNDERQDFLVNLSHGPIMVVECFSGYKVNGCRFHTKQEMKVKQHIIVACVSKELAKVIKFQGLIIIYFTKLFVLNLRVSQLKNVYFLI